jgi:CubicO group peptidase (beta-lactamase class C family)
MSGIRVDESMVHGEVAPGFEDVETEFRRNFSVRGELGAACAVYCKGEKVVDLWGGYRDAGSRAPWERDTLVAVFSTTKGLAAMTLAVAHSQGLIDYDERVAVYWPEFAQHGKGEITVRQLLSHQAGLAVLDEPLTVEQVADLDLVAGILARQRPIWKPGSRNGYHAATLGLYMNECIRRVDPRHRSLGQFFQDEVAEPLDLEFYIGLPDEVPDSRIATIQMISPVKALYKMPWRLVLGFLNPRSLFFRAMMIPRGGFDPNDRLHRSVELPSGNGIGQVRSMAKAYSVLATGGKELNLKKETIEELTAPAVPPEQGPYDEIIGIDSYFSLGYSKPGPDVSFGSSRRAFGTPGSGGSFAFADPDVQVGYTYAMTKMGYSMKDDPREKSLRDAVYRCLKR